VKRQRDQDDPERDDAGEPSASERRLASVSGLGCVDDLGGLAAWCRGTRLPVPDAKHHLRCAMAPESEAQLFPGGGHLDRLREHRGGEPEVGDGEQDALKGVSGTEFVGGEVSRSAEDGDQWLWFEVTSGRSRPVAEGSLWEQVLRFRTGSAGGGRNAVAVRFVGPGPGRQLGYVARVLVLQRVS
jgi:hypothetical protein